MANLAIIPARGGSKRIPKKNIKHFLGKPIISYPIEVALESKIFDEVVVSTDDEEIAQIAQKLGAKVPFIRSKKNADDYAPLYEVAKEVLLWYKDRNFFYDKVSCILATSAFIKKEYIIKAYDLLQNTDVDSVLPVVPYSYPIQRALKKNEKGELVFFHPENYHKRSQDLEQGYHDAGMFYFTKTDSFFLPENNRLSSGVVKPLVINEMSCHDIDTIEDWEIAEFKYKMGNL